MLHGYPQRTRGERSEMTTEAAGSTCRALRVRVRTYVRTCVWTAAVSDVTEPLRNREIYVGVGNGPAGLAYIWLFRGALRTEDW